MEPRGAAMTISADALATEALELAQARPAEARDMAERALRGPDARAATRSMAHEALGLAAKEMHNLDASLEALRKSVSIAARAGLRQRSAQARMSLAFVLLTRGEPQRALREANTAGRVLEGLDAARLQMRRGVILQRLGRLDEALTAYQDALPALRRADDRLWEARLLSNRGVLHVYRSEFAAADRDLRRAARLHDQLGQGLAAAQTRHNLGFAAARRGDVPSALAWYDKADQAYRDLGLVDWVGLADRCELLLSTRLLDEARQLASDAVAQLSRAGNASDLAEARLALANAALLQGDERTARQVAEEAREEFSQQHRPRWAAMARYVALRARWLGGDRSRDLQEAALRTSAALARAGWDLAAVDARLVAARIALERGDTAAAQRALGGTAAARRRGPAELRARAWHAEALLRLARGNTRGADTALRAGMRALHRHRATLGSTELRTHVAGYAGDIATQGLQLAVDAGDPERVLRWAERWRAGTLFLRPVRPPEDEQLTADLAALRDAVAELDRAALLGQDTAPLIRRQATLERAVQRRTRQARGDGGDDLEELAADRLVEALGEAALVEMIALGDRLLGVVVADGRMRLRSLGSKATAQSETEALRFALRRLARPQASPRAREAARTAATFAAARLDELLLRPLLDVVDDRDLIVVPSGPLHALPWSFLPSCRMRSVAVAPSAQLWLHARTARTADGHRGGTVLIGCPEPPHAQPEVRSLAARYTDSRVLLGTDASVHAVTAALDGAGVAHLACHGRFRADNPLFSCLQLADGPLTVYDLERLERAPGLLLLSACDSGLSSVQPGDELMGLSSALFSLGTATLIASVAPVPDAGTRAFMLSLHHHLDAGEPPARALALARAEAGTEDDADVSAAAFVCFGAG